MPNDNSSPGQRRHERTKTKLLGRYLLADGRESKCQLIDISIGGVALAAPERGTVGESVVLYVDQIGRLQGTIVRHLDGGFALKLDASPHAAARLSRRLDEVLPGGAGFTGPERRREPRFPATPADAIPSVVKSGFDVINISVLGAELKLNGRQPRPPIGTVIHVGKASGQVVRHTLAGVAIEFRATKVGTLGGRLDDIR